MLHQASNLGLEGATLLQTDHRRALSTRLNLQFMQGWRGQDCPHQGESCPTQLILTSPLPEQTQPNSPHFNDNVCTIEMQSIKQLIICTVNKSYALQRAPAGGNPMCRLARRKCATNSPGSPRTCNCQIRPDVLAIVTRAEGRPRASSAAWTSPTSST